LCCAMRDVRRSGDHRGAQPRPRKKGESGGKGKGKKEKKEGEVDVHLAFKTRPTLFPLTTEGTEKEEKGEKNLIKRRREREGKTSANKSQLGIDTPFVYVPS